MGRLELPRPCERWNLNPVRLPIPPHPLAERNCFSVTFRSTASAFGASRSGLQKTQKLLRIAGELRERGDGVLIRIEDRVEGNRYSRKLLVFEFLILLRFR